MTVTLIELKHLINQLRIEEVFKGMKTKNHSSPTLRLNKQRPKKKSYKQKRKKKEGFPNVQIKRQKTRGC